MALLNCKVILSHLLLTLCFLFTHKNVIHCLNEDKILTELTTSNTPFTNETINYFIRLVREKYNYDMINIHSRLKKYPAMCNDTCDIQIFYNNVINSGRYLCVYYDPNYKKVYIYNSYSEFTTNFVQLSDKVLSIIEQRYTMAEKAVFVMPKTRQYDETSNGPLAIAYATTLILGETPAVYGFNMNDKHADESLYLRKHIFEMFRKKELSPFPRSSRPDIKNIYGEINPLVLAELKTPNKPFSLLTINLFNDLVAATTSYDMVSILFDNEYPELYPTYNDTQNDVQILYSRGKNDEEPGHYLCIFYEAAVKTVFVYDSLYYQDLSEQQKFIINRRQTMNRLLTLVRKKNNGMAPRVDRFLLHMQLH